MSMDRKPPFDWNTNVTALARQMFEAGWRSAEIAEIIGTTRDTVTAKATRCQWDKAMRRQYGADKPIQNTDPASVAYSSADEAVSYRVACDAHLADLRAAHGEAGSFPTYRNPSSGVPLRFTASAFDRVSVIGSQF